MHNGIQLSLQLTHYKHTIAAHVLFLIVLYSLNTMYEFCIFVTSHCTGSFLVYIGNSHSAHSANNNNNKKCDEMNEKTNKWHCSTGISFFRVSRKFRMMGQKSAQSESKCEIKTEFFLPYFFWSRLTTTGKNGVFHRSTLQPPSTNSNFKGCIGQLLTQKNWFFGISKFRPTLGIEAFFTSMTHSSENTHFSFQLKFSHQ